MTNDEFRSWAMKVWEKEAIRSMPAARARRVLQASQREYKKELARARRSLVAFQAASQRKLNKRLAELDRESREWREAQDAESDRRLWNLLLGHGRPGV